MVDLCFVRDFFIQFFFFSSRRRHTRCALVTGVQTCALPISVERLDPSANGKLLSKRGFLDKIFGSKISNYFAQYRSAQSHISGILTALSNGKDELLMDNAAIDVERRRMWESMGKLEIGRAHV